MSRAARSLLQVVPEPAELVHALVQHDDNADRAIAQGFPVDIMLLVTEYETLDAEFCGHRTGRDIACRNSLKRLEQALDIRIRSPS